MPRGQSANSVVFGDLVRLWYSGGNQENLKLKEIVLRDTSAQWCISMPLSLDRRTPWLLEKL